VHPKSRTSPECEIGSVSPLTLRHPSNASVTPLAQAHTDTCGSVHQAAEEFAVLQPVPRQVQKKTRLVVALLLHSSLRDDTTHLTSIVHTEFFVLNAYHQKLVFHSYLILLSLSSVRGNMLTTFNRGQDGLPRTQGAHCPGQEQVQLAKVPPRCPLHQQGHRLPDRFGQARRRRGPCLRLLARTPPLRHQARPHQLGRCLRHGPARCPPRAEEARAGREVRGRHRAGRDHFRDGSDGGRAPPLQVLPRRGPEAHVDRLARVWRAQGRLGRRHLHPPQREALPWLRP
jgi:hypothetical protein